jgi:NAD(P)-dependent dehydrogenase (short-subunit alcohol dehydrogenase family)
MERDFDGKVVIVTGAGSGLGRAASLLFARRGAMLCLAGRTAAKIEDTAGRIAALGGTAVTCAGELSDSASCKRVIDAAIEAFGGIDILCNVAAEVTLGHFDQVSEAQWNRTIATNLSVPFFMMRHAMPHIMERHGNVVNVSSTGGLMGQAYLGPYTASKFGLLGLTRSLAMEYMDSPVRINALAPGTMATEMATASVIPDDVDPRLFSRYCGIRPPSTAEDVAETLVYLASDAAKAVHGACFAADGGITTG